MLSNTHANPRETSVVDTTKLLKEAHATPPPPKKKNMEEERRISSNTQANPRDTSVVHATGLFTEVHATRRNTKTLVNVVHYRQPLRNTDSGFAKALEKIKGGKERRVYCNIRMGETGKSHVHVNRTNNGGFYTKHTLCKDLRQGQAIIPSVQDVRYHLHLHLCGHMTMAPPRFTTTFSKHVHVR